MLQECDSTRAMAATWANSVVPNVLVVQAATMLTEAYASLWLVVVP